LAFALTALVVYAPALRGAFFSDDLHYVVANAYIQAWSVANWLAIWDPTSPVAVIVENYAPVHLLLHSLAWHAFGPDVLGHHVVNVLLHALAACLLVPVFTGAGVPRAAAIALATVFLVHPANVEAVAWISQLKTPAAMVLMLLALHWQRRRPLLAWLGFCAALLAKPSAAVALPVAALWEWTQPSRRPSRWRWLAAWALAFTLFSGAEFAAFFQTAGAGAAAHANPDMAVRLRGVLAAAARYVVMALTGRGLSVFHEPAVPVSLFDPWWLAALLLFGLLGWRSAVLVRRRPRIDRDAAAELGFWLWAVVSFAPTSGVIPLPFAMADRYLYFVLPGLLGGLWFVGREAATRLALPGWLRTPRAAALLAASCIALFGVQANARAALWRSDTALLEDAARNYPDGRIARMRLAREAARAGDADRAVRILRGLVDGGYDRLDQLLADPAFRVLRGGAAFDGLVEDMARAMIARIEARAAPAQHELRVLAQAYLLVGDRQQALACYDRALSTGGPAGPEIRAERDALRRALRFETERAKRQRLPPVQRR